jgi:putative DNA primase/helicase
MNHNDFSAIPAELTALPQWVCWHYETRNGKQTKPPIQAQSNGKLLYAASDNPATWSDFATAVKAKTRLNLEGIGLNVWEGDRLTGIDMDKIIDPVTGALDPLAAEAVGRFSGTYTEISPSGTGIRIWCYGKPGRTGKVVGKVKWLEVYAHPSHRYLTVTGNPWPGSATTVTHQQDALDWLHSRFMAKTDSTEGETQGSSNAPHQSPVEASLDLDDAALLDKARNAKNGSSFNALWSGDTSRHGGDHSSADMALLNALAFWTNKDSDRMDRLFRQSGLMRPKWDVVHDPEGQRTYGQISIDKAIADCREGYSGKKKAANQQSVNHSQAASSSESLIAYDKKGNPFFISHNQAAKILYSCEFKSLLFFDPITEYWYRYQQIGILALHPELLIQQAVYRAIEKRSEGVGFYASYTAGVAKCLMYESIRQPVAPRGVICFRNGVLNLRDRVLYPHSPDYFFISQLPFDWLPNAPDPQVVIDWLLEAVGGHSDQVRLLRAWINAIIQSRPDLQRFLEIIGDGGSGKGTFTRLCLALLGKDAVHSTMLKQLEENRFETARIFGKKLTVITDAEKWHGDVSVLKSITGQDAIRFEEKNKQAGDPFVYGGMVMISANQHTTSTDYSSGIQRRRITLHFDHVVPAELRRDLDAEFEPFLPNVVRWALDMPDKEVTAYLRSTSSRVGSLQGVRMEALEATNPIVSWLRCSIAFDPTLSAQVGNKAKVSVSTSDGVTRETRTVYEDTDTRLYPNYCQWCDHTGKQPISLQGFTRTVVDCARNMLGKTYVAKGTDRRNVAVIHGIAVKRSTGGTAGDLRVHAGDYEGVYPLDCGDKIDYGDLNRFENNEKETDWDDVGFDPESASPDFAKFKSLRDKSPSVPIITAINGLDPCKVPIKSPSSPLQNPISGGLAPDPAALWEKLRIYNGSEVARRLAQKMGWGVERTMVAAQSLVSHGLASMSGDLVSPVKGRQA